jgi:hypothetical protein
MILTRSGLTVGPIPTAKYPTCIASSILGNRVSQKLPMIAAAVARWRGELLLFASRAVPIDYSFFDAKFASRINSQL